MAPRSKEYVPETALLMRSNPDAVIAFIETGVQDLELDHFEAIAAAIVCYGEKELSERNGLHQSSVSRTKRLLEDKNQSEDKRMRAALTALPWFGLKNDIS